MEEVILLLGSNEGDRVWQINLTKKLIVKFIGSILQESQLYQSAPWGFDSQQLFLNQAIVVSTLLPPTDLMNSIINIEALMGRDKTQNSLSKPQYKDRRIDIDILFYGDLVIETPFLTIPHPLLHLREFALKPLLDICADYQHPKLKKSIRTMLQELGSSNEVSVFTR